MKVTICVVTYVESDDYCSLEVIIYPSLKFALQKHPQENRCIFFDINLKTFLKINSNINVFMCDNKIKKDLKKINWSKKQHKLWFNKMFNLKKKIESENA